MRLKGPKQVQRIRKKRRTVEGSGQTLVTFLTGKLFLCIQSPILNATYTAGNRSRDLHYNGRTLRNHRALATSVAKFAISESSQLGVRRLRTKTRYCYGTCSGGHSLSHVTSKLQHFWNLCIECDIPFMSAGL